jgi:hypothetical protein
MKRGILLYLLLAGWLAWSCSPAWSQCVGGQCYTLDVPVTAEVVAPDRSAVRARSTALRTLAQPSQRTTGPLRRIIARIRARRMR